MKLKENEPLSEHTTFRIGGPARYFIEAKTIAELQAALNFAKGKKLKVLFLGKGSNALISDKGFNGLVIKLRLSRTGVSGESVVAESGVSVAQLVNLTAKKGLTGLEFLTGIPGTVGGAVAMNAGVGKFAIGDKIKRVWGLRKTFSKSECKFGYRRSIFQVGKYIITKVEFKLKKGNKAKIRATIKQMWQKRLEKQPYDLPSAGSVFKNPKGKFAGQLIEEAGCKGLRVRGAEVSKMHANFIVNRGKARAKDVIQLMKAVQKKVKKAFGVTLEPEIKFVN